MSSPTGEKGTREGLTGSKHGHSLVPEIRKKKKMKIDQVNGNQDPSTQPTESPRPAPERFRNFVLEESRKGNVVVMGIEGPMVAPLDEFIKQPAEGILYDLNRLPEVVLTFIDDPKWVNDFAVSMVIKRLREQQRDSAGRGDINVTE